MAAAAALAAAFVGATLAGSLRVGAPWEPSAFQSIVDDWGRTVKVPLRVERIISLAPSTTEILFALGVGNRVVGISDYTDYPPEATKITLVLTNMTVNYEKVIELHPDLILAAEINSRQDVDRLANLFAVLVLAPKDIDGIMKDIRLVGKATGAEQGAAKVVDQMSVAVASVKARVANRTSTPRVFYFLDFGDYNNPLGGGAWTGGKGTFWDALITLAGGENIAHDIDGWKIYGLESIIAKDPQVLILGQYVPFSASQLQGSSGWEDVSAVRSGKVYQIQDAAVFDRPDPRIVQGLEWLAKTLHPELYKAQVMEPILVTNGLAS